MNIYEKHYVVYQCDNINYNSNIYSINDIYLYAYTDVQRSGDHLDNS